MFFNNRYGMGMIQTRICKVRIRKDVPGPVKKSYISGTQFIGIAEKFLFFC
jgi:hypothetical protein